MCALAHHDYAMLATKLGKSQHTIRNIFEQSRFDRLLVKDLKECIRYLRDKDRRRWSHLRLQGRKSDLINTLYSAMELGSQRDVVAMTTPSDSIMRVMDAHLRQYDPPEEKLNVDSLYQRSKDSKLRSPFVKVVRKIWAKEYYSMNPLRDLFYVDAETLTQLRYRSLRMHLVMIDTDGSIKPFDRGFRIRINDTHVEPPEQRVMKGVKKKGLIMQPRLDVTDFAHSSMKIDISMPEILNNFMPRFRAVVAFEVVKVLTAEEVMAEHMRKLQDHKARTANLPGSSGDAKAAITLKAASSSLSGDAGVSHNHPKQCHVCGVTKDLLRCSRCKARWYCGHAHQRDDWHRHKAECKDPAQRAREVEKQKSEHSGMKRSRPAEAQEPDSSDELIQMDVVLTLNCPLSCGRIQTAARGKNCNHPQCFDLLTYIEFSHMSHVWQCPVCLKALPLDAIIVDEEMNRILKECHEDVTQIRKAADGSYKAVDPPAESSSESQRKRKMAKTEQTKPEDFLDLSVNGSAPGSPVEDTRFAIHDQGSSMDNAIVLD
mmetsp:Transcript_27423/g.51186  ORF Transcript_27423/g.51186 Transcript_27423/m.51186 type:complete len:543 (-) Transcript_27423:197-1825(-)